MLRRLTEHQTSPFILSILGFVCYWLALPPVGLWFLAFLVPFFWTFLMRCGELGVHSNPPEHLVSSMETSAELPIPGVMATKAVRTIWSLPKRSFLKVRRFFCSIFFSAYGQLWFSAFLFWLLEVRWIGFPCPATQIGWIVSAIYLACYFPFFVATARGMIYRIGLPPIISVAVAWGGTECLRKIIFGGFSFASLEHAFYQHPIWIQTAELGGETLVGMFLFVFGALAAYSFRLIFDPLDAKMNRWSHQQERPSSNESTIITYCVPEQYVPRPFLIRFGYLFVLIIFLTAFFLFGYFRMQDIDQKLKTSQQDKTPFRIALLQQDKTFEFPVDAECNRWIHERYSALTDQAVQEGLHQKKPLDLVVWPESCYTEGGYAEIFNKKTNQTEFPENRSLIEQAQNFKTPLLLGLVSFYGVQNKNGTAFEQRNFKNSAILVEPEGNLTCYSKIHLVIFGEYFPLEDWIPDSFPWKATLCQSIAPGNGSVPMVLKQKNNPQNELVLLPNICFESSDLQLIARHIKEAQNQDKNPDVLVNLSNDGWFKNSFQTDLHLATHVFRAVENRRSCLTATHAGFSAAIDAQGKILVKGERKKEGIIVAEIYPISPDIQTFNCLFRFPFLCLCFQCLTILFCLIKPKNR